jgi:hypothetical protein
VTELIIFKPNVHLLRASNAIWNLHAKATRLALAPATEPTRQPKGPNAPVHRKNLTIALLECADERQHLAALLALSLWHTRHFSLAMQRTPLRIEHQFAK